MLIAPHEGERLGGLRTPLTDAGRRNWDGFEKLLRTIFEAPACRLGMVPGAAFASSVPEGPEAPAKQR